MSWQPLDQGPPQVAGRARIAVHIVDDERDELLAAIDRPAEYGCLLDEIDERSRAQIQERYFKRSFESVWEETRGFYAEAAPEEIAKAEANPKHKMALIFRWYFVHTMRLAETGSAEQKVDYQIHCGPALGAFNQWVRGSALEDWRNRRVAEIALMLMEATAALLNERFEALSAPVPVAESANA